MAEKTNIAGVQEVCQQLYDAHGKIETRALVEAARPKTSPAHSAFEWNDKKAGHEYRLWQARYYIRRVTVIVEDEPERLIHVPRVVMTEPVDEQPRDGHYQVASVLVKRPDEFSRALNAAQCKLDAARRALDELHAVAEMADRSNDALKIAQMSKANQLFAEALRSMH